MKETIFLGLAILLGAQASAHESYGLYEGWQTDDVCAFESLAYSQGAEINNFGTVLRCSGTGDSPAKWTDGEKKPANFFCLFDGKKFSHGAELDGQKCTNGSWQ